MPKRYHRPPADKRRKRRTVSYEFGQAPQPEDGTGGEAAAEALEAPEYEPEEEAPAVAPARAGLRVTASHLTRDHSYVRAEIVRILVIIGFLVVSLVITAMLRN